MGGKLVCERRTRGDRSSGARRDPGSDQQSGGIFGRRGAWQRSIQGADCVARDYDHPIARSVGIRGDRKHGPKSLHDIRGRRYPLRVSLRGQKDHALHPIVVEVLAAAGLSLDDIVSWGGQIRYDDGLPMKSNRFGAMQRGEVDMIVDEAVRGWINAAAEAGMRALPLDEAMLSKLEAIGLRRAVIPKARYPKMTGMCRRSISAALRFTPMRRCPTMSSARFAPRWKHARTGSAGKNRDRCRSIGCAAIRLTVRW